MVPRNNQKISAIICTYNQANLLRGAVESLIHQTLPAAVYEIIVVDNASRDQTAKVVREFAAVENLRYCFEARIGLAHARNAGVGCARTGLVAFLDDDARAEPDWLEYALECYANVRPTPDILGGPILPEYCAPRPGWFLDRYELRTWGAQPRYLSRTESFSGSNMFFRKETVERYGGFDVRVDMRSEFLSLGSETALFDRIWNESDGSVAMYYSPRLVVRHRVPAYKMTVAYQWKRAFVTGQVWFVLRGPKSFWRRADMLTRAAIVALLRIIRAPWRLRKGYVGREWLAQEGLPIMTELGRLAGGLDLRIQVRQRPRIHSSMDEG